MGLVGEGQACPPVVIVAVIDSNAVDLLVDDEYVREAIRGAIHDGRLRLLSTSVTYDQVGETKVARRRGALPAALSEFSEGAG